MSKNNYINVLLIGGSSVLGGLINYIYHPIMLKFMTLEEFGAFGSLIGIFNILGILVVGFDLFLNKTFSAHLEDKNYMKFVYIHAGKLFFVSGMIFYLFYALFSGFIASKLKIDETFLVLFSGLAIVLGFLGIANGAFLKSIKSFSFISFLQLLGPIVKLVLGVALVYFGYGIFGALFGFIFSSFFGIFLSIIFIFRYLKKYNSQGKMKDMLMDFQKNKWEILHFFLLSLFFAILMNSDVIFVRNIFSEEMSGIYTAIAILGKFLIFLLLSVETVYFGQIMEYSRKKVPPHLVRNPIIIIAVCSFFALLVNFFFGSFILGILEKELVAYTNIYLWSLVFYGLLSFISFFVKILIGWKKYIVNLVLFFLVFLLCIFVYTLGKSSLLAFIQSFVVVGFLGTILTGGLFLKEYKQKNN